MLLNENNNMKICEFKDRDDYIPILRSSDYCSHHPNSEYCGYVKDKTETIPQCKICTSVDCKYNVTGKCNYCDYIDKCKNKKPNSELTSYYMLPKLHQWKPFIQDANELPSITINRIFNNEIEGFSCINFTHLIIVIICLILFSSVYFRYF